MDNAILKRPRFVTPLPPPSVIHIRNLELTGDGLASDDLRILLDLLEATSDLRIVVETYDPHSGFYRIAVCGSLSR